MAGKGTYTAYQALEKDTSDYGAIAQKAATNELSYKADRRAEEQLGVVKDQEARAKEKFQIEKDAAFDEQFKYSDDIVDLSGQALIDALHMKLAGETRTQINDTVDALRLDPDNQALRRKYQQLTTTGKQQKVFSDLTTKGFLDAKTLADAGKLSNRDAEKLRKMGEALKNGKIQPTIDNKTGETVQIMIGEDGERTVIKESELQEFFVGLGGGTDIDDFISNQVKAIGAKTTSRPNAQGGVTTTQSFESAKTQIEIGLEAALQDEAFLSDTLYEMDGEDKSKWGSDKEKEADIKRAKEYLSGQIELGYKETEQTTVKAPTETKLSASERAKEQAQIDRIQTISNLAAGDTGFLTGLPIRSSKLKDGVAMNTIIGSARVVGDNVFITRDDGSEELVISLTDNIAINELLDTALNQKVSSDAINKMERVTPTKTGGKYEERGDSGLEALNSFEKTTDSVKSKALYESLKPEMEARGVDITYSASTIGGDTIRLTRKGSSTKGSMSIKINLNSDDVVEQIRNAVTTLQTDKLKAVEGDGGFDAEAFYKKNKTK